MKPNIINGFDFSVTFFSGKLEDEESFSSFLRRFEKGLFTLKIDFKNN